MENAKKVLDIATKTLPSGLRAELLRVLGARGVRAQEISEIRLRHPGYCSVITDRGRVRAEYRLTRDEIEGVTERLCLGAVYAYRDTISQGYIPYEGGIRVGVCGSARYEGGKIAGIEKISSLVFRLPSRKSELCEELFSAFSGVRSGLVIYSAPGGGKTAALRSLALAVGGGKTPQKVCVVDERGEFSPEDFKDAEVDILTGYKKRSGIEIATRSLSAEVIMVDEIGADEASELLPAVRCGIKIVATAHAGCGDELLSRAGLKPLFEAGAFDRIAGIFKENGKRRLEVRQI